MIEKFENSNFFINYYTIPIYYNNRNYYNRIIIIQIIVPINYRLFNLPTTQNVII